MQKVAVRSLLQAALEDLLRQCLWPSARGDIAVAMVHLRSTPWDHDRLLLGVRTLASWCGVMNLEWFHLLVGGRQGTTGMPLMWECVAGFVFSPLVEHWQHLGYGVVVPTAMVACDIKGQPRMTES